MTSAHPTRFKAAEAPKTSSLFSDQLIDSYTKKFLEIDDSRYVHHVQHICKKAASYYQALKYNHNIHLHEEVLQFINDNKDILNYGLGVEIENFDLLEKEAETNLLVDQKRTTQYSNIQPQAVADVDAGAGLSQVARKYGTSKQNVLNWVKASKKNQNLSK
jgi:DNA-binding phage protein